MGVTSNWDVSMPGFPRQATQMPYRPSGTTPSRTSREANSPARGLANIAGGGSPFTMNDFVAAVAPSLPGLWGQQAMASAYPQSAYAGTAGQRAQAGATQAVGAMGLQEALARLPYDLEAATRQSGYPSQASVYGSDVGAMANMYGSGTRLTGLREVLSALSPMLANMSGGAGGVPGGIPNITTPYGGGYTFS